MKMTSDLIDKRIVFVGASGHGKVCAEIAKLNGYSDIFFLDDDNSVKKCGIYDVQGTTKDIDKYIDENTSFFVSIGNCEHRARIQSEIEHIGGKVATLVHPGSIVSSESVIGTGSVVMAGAVINPCTTLGKGVIVNTGSSVDHDCNIGDWCHVSVGSHVCGTVKVDSKSWVGAGSIIVNNISVCDGCVIGAGAVVVKDIYESGTYIGIPARKV